MASAKTHTEKGNYDRAITDFDEAIRLDPKVAVSFYRRGLAYDHQGQHNRAIADFDEAIRLDPNFTQAIKSRAEAIALMASRVTNKLAASGVINEIQRWLDRRPARNLVNNKARPSDNPKTVLIKIAINMVTNRLPQ